MVKLIKKLRLWIQIGFTAITNSYVKGFLDGRIYTGSLKSICLPGLNCYSCPGALGSCPIGALQSVLASRNYGISFYLTGFFMMIGAFWGRFVCGWLCPFGLIQDLLNKIPFAKKITKIRGDKYLRLIKYGILLGFVILLPIFVLDLAGQGEPWFCKWICPSGTLFAGWPLALLNDGIQKTVGFLFVWKSFILIALILLSVMIYRPFCKYICPLGAIYGIFNPIAFYKFQIDQSKCTNCLACQRACKMNIPVNETPNSMECIRCGDCISACKTKAISKVHYDLPAINDIMKKKKAKRRTEC